MPQDIQQSNKPELKIGPFAGGVSVDLWRNTINTDHGHRQTRSFTISRRQYRDSETDEWKESSYRITDGPVIQLALEKLSAHVAAHPLSDDEDTPF